MPFAENDLSQDRFLGGKLTIWQPRAGYRAATDPVFLAASVPAKAGQSVLELGCGAGVALLCLGHRVSGLALQGIEIQPDYAELAMLNAQKNGLTAGITIADLTALPASITAQSFDHVIANPPYLTAGAGTAAADAGKETAFRAETPLSVWVDVAVKRLRPRGLLTMIHLAEKLPALLGSFDARLGDITVKPIAARQGRAANRVLVQAQKGSKGPFTLVPPLIVHNGDRHEADQESYTAEVQRILRDGQALPF